jgi:hypothetical protein
MKKVNNEFFDEINNEEKAYLLGYFLADGCITRNNNYFPNSNSLRIGLSEIDKLVIEWFKYFIAPDNKIVISNYQKGAKNRKPVHSLKWTSKYMSNILQTKYNILPRKTEHFNFKFPFDEIQKDFLFDFIRGFFDGDGVMSFSSGRLIFGFYSTSKEFLEDLGRIFEKEFNCKYVVDLTKPNNKIKLFCLRFNKGSNSSKAELFTNIYQKFYKDKKFYLKRKKEKMEFYLNTVLNKEINKSLSV